MTATFAKVSASKADIRPALEKDIASIQSMAQRIWPVCFAGIIPPEKLTEMVERIYSEENLVQEVKSGHRFWVASLDGKPVGYVSAYKEKYAVWLKKLYLDPEHQGKGIGATMMRTAVASFLPASEIRLLVNNGNLSAQRFYERMGFTWTEEVAVTMGGHAFTDYLYIKPLNADSAHV